MLAEKIFIDFLFPANKIVYTSLPVEPLRIPILLKRCKVERKEICAFNYGKIQHQHNFWYFWIRDNLIFADGDTTDNSCR